MSKQNTTQRRMNHMPNDAVPILKMRIEELENQVNEYKKKLETLRKAKNTTVLKREREIINVEAPQLGRRASRVQDNREEELDKLKEILEVERKNFRTELERLKSSKHEEPQILTCNHPQEIERLHKELLEHKEDKEMLMVNNSELQDRVESLMNELSKKEAIWCQREEQLKIQVKTEWGKKYQEWMSKTEQKLADLQQANNILKQMVQRGRPSGPDPTGQEGS